MEVSEQTVNSLETGDPDRVVHNRVLSFSIVCLSVVAYHQSIDPQALYEMVLYPTEVFAGRSGEGHACA